MALAACGQATEAAPLTGGQTERPAPGLTRVAQPRYAPSDFQAGVMVLVYGNDPAFASNPAFANGTMVRFLDINDTYRTVDGSHPSDNLSAVLAVAEMLGSSGREALMALIVP